LLHVVDIYILNLDHIASVNQNVIGYQSKVTNRLLWFSIKLTAKPFLTIDEDDLMTEKHQDTIQRRVEVHLMSRVEKENALCSFLAKQRKIEEFRAPLMKVVRQIHITRFPSNKFYILIIKM
jgi:GTP-binding protein HflX